ncbi:hypothetical protein [Pseudoxanthomonas sp. UC19_8]|uniref:hypothetical protein n=1 Tax=Pseudoxanthomonas sp. UC19_8 TaxID=3350175 RepID=UPI0036D42AB2
MKSQRLKAALDPWMREATWHTFDGLDEQRFHRALAAAFEVLGTPADALDLETAMLELAREHHGEVTRHHLEVIDERAQFAEAVSLYLHNTK